MGLVLNPYAFRVGHVNSWSDSWYLISTEYVEFLHSSIMLKSFIYYVLFKFYPTRFSYWLISHIEILFFNNNMYIWLYLYEASGKYKITKYIKLFKYGLFKDYRLRTYWLKKNLFDKNPIALSIFNFLRLFGSHIEAYDSVENYVFDNRIRAKLASLRKRYGYKWLGIEEIYILRTSLAMFKRSANRFALSRLSMMIKSLFFLPIRDGSLSINKLKGPRVFIFFFSYFLLILKQWPYYKSWAKHFGSKIVFVFLRQTVFFLFFNPFIKYLSKFIEYLCSFFGYSSVVRASIITNFSLSAFFIARYIMTAIKNGFNYWDILFPIRKTLGRFMEIKLFDNFINKQTPLKTNLVNRAVKSVNRRVNLVIFFVLFLKYKLFFDDFYKSLYSFDSYNKLFCFLQYLNRRKQHGFVFNSSRLIVLHKSYIFRRFINIFKKKFFEYINKRIISERVNEIIRLTKKPLTLIQKEKYNKRRRMKRLEKRSMIDLSEVRETYLELNRKFNSRLSSIKTFSHSFQGGRRDLMIQRRIKRFFYINSKNKIVKKTYKPTNVKFLIKLYIILLIVKILKNVRLKMKKQKLVFNKKVSKKNRKKIIKKQILKLNKKNLIIKRRKLMLSLIMLFFWLRKKTYDRVYFKKFPLFYYRLDLTKKWRIFSIAFSKFFLVKSIKKNSNVKIFKKKLLKRSYHSSNYFFTIIDILKELTTDNKKFNKRKARINFRRIYKKMIPKDYRNHSITANNMPSIILTRLFKNSNDENVNSLKKILNDINIIFLLVDYINSLPNNKHLNHRAIIFNIKLYEVLYYLLLLKLYGHNHYKINKMFTTIIRQCFVVQLNTKNYNACFLLNKAFATIRFNIIKYIRSYCITSNYLKKSRFIMFNFIEKFARFFSNSRVQINSFNYYFFFLLNSLLRNYNNSINFNNNFIKRLLILLDNYWYNGFFIFKRYSAKKLEQFVNKFHQIFSIVFFIFKFMFAKIRFNDSYFPIIYRLLRQLIPKEYKPHWLRYRREFFPYSINSGFEFKLFEKYYKYTDSEYFNHYMIVNENINYVGRDSFHVFLNSFYYYNTFPIPLNSYIIYIDSLNDSFDKTFSLHTNFISNKLLPYGDKIIRNKARDHIKSFLYGFKFHFVGRFTRKQQSASMWFRQGFLPSSSMKADVDYGIFTIPLKYSACTVKVWLYKGFYVPKRTFSYGKWL